MSQLQRSNNEDQEMKNFILGAVALSLAGAFTPVVASAAPMHKSHATHYVKPHHVRCHFEKKRVRHHGHWVIRTVKVCR
ncbi:MAG TPA: hypothetical protein VHA37_01330 [Candidatus Saccharimonadales bacterium]|nr:hypothetical protein [Candidatus Saccharimonadales bacterium]